MMRPTKSRSWFTRLTKATARVTGRPGNAKNELLDIEELEESDLDNIRASYRDIAREARSASG